MKIKFLPFLVVISLSASFMSCNPTPKPEVKLNLATITSNLTVDSITSNSAIFGGIITADNGDAVTKRGICWSVKQNPSITDSIKTSGLGIGAFTCKMKNLTPSTMYYVRAFATNGSGTVYGGNMIFTTFAGPSITCSNTTSITFSSAKVTCKPTLPYLTTILAGGVCWSTTENPTTSLTTKTTNGTAVDSFVCMMSNLSPTTKYYYRAYITTPEGTFYSAQNSFTTIAKPLQITDYDGNVYTSVTIGTQTWLVENLKTTHFNNGDVIPTTSYSTDSDYNPYQWPANGSDGYVSTYGRLYTWAVVNDSRGVAPAGYRVASASDWSILLDYLNTNGDSGFTFSLAGYRGYDGFYYLIGVGADFWTSTSTNSTQATIRYGGDIAHLISNGPKTDSNKTYGFSVRCIKN
jgi:Fibrobacter succinogenes major domain (Fib_succ_major)